MSSTEIKIETVNGPVTFIDGKKEPKPKPSKAPAKIEVWEFTAKEYSDRPKQTTADPAKKARRKTHDKTKQIPADPAKKARRKTVGASRQRNRR